MWVQIQDQTGNLLMHWSCKIICDLALVERYHKVKMGWRFSMFPHSLNCPPFKLMAGCSVLCPLAPLLVSPHQVEALEGPLYSNRERSRRAPAQGWTGDLLMSLASTLMSAYKSNALTLSCKIVCVLLSFDHSFLFLKLLFLTCQC